jgi:hypothetical protein
LNRLLKTLSRHGNRAENTARQTIVQVTTSYRENRYRVCCEQLNKLEGKIIITIAPSCPILPSHHINNVRWHRRVILQNSCFHRMLMLLRLPLSEQAASFSAVSYPCASSMMAEFVEIAFTVVHRLAVASAFAAPKGSLVLRGARRSCSSL